MTHVDGFVAAVPTANREAYRQHAEAAAVVFKKYGALKLVECWGDDVPEGILAFSVKQFEQHHLQRPAAIVRENQAKDNAADCETPSPAAFEKPIPTEAPERT